MGKKAAGHLSNRLLAFGADPATPVTVVAHASRMDETVIHTTLGRLAQSVRAHCGPAPAVILYGIGAREAAERRVTASLEKVA